MLLQALRLLWVLVFPISITCSLGACALHIIANIPSLNRAWCHQTKLSGVPSGFVLHSAWEHVMWFLIAPFWSRYEGILQLKTFNVPFPGACLDS